MISAHFWAPVRGAKFDRKLAEPNTRWRDFSLNRDSCAATLLYTAAVLHLFYIVIWSDFKVTYTIKTTDFWNSVPENSTSKITKLYDKNNKVSLLLSFYFRIFKTFILYTTVFSRKFLKRKKNVGIPVYLPLLLMECTFLKSWFLLACIFILATFPYKDLEESFTLTNG